jgi:integrase
VQIKLTDIVIRNLPHQQKQITYFDAAYACLALRVGQRTKTWVVSVGTPRRLIRIGHWPKMGIAEARRKAGQMIEPTGGVYGLTVRSAAEEYLRSLQLRPRTKSDYQRILDVRVLPVLSDRRLLDIHARDVLAVTDPLHDRPSERRKTHAVLNAFFSWTVPRHLAQSPMVGLKPPGYHGKRSRVLSYDELKNIWHASKQLGDFGRVIALCILTAQRRGQFAAVQNSWITPSSVVFPAAVMKNKRDHELPLTARARELLALPLRCVTWNKPKARLEQLSGVITPHWQIHDLRRSFSSHLNDADPRLHWAIERVLAHAVPGVAGVYNRSQLLNQQREALELWEAELVKRGVITTD